MTLEDIFSPGKIKTGISSSNGIERPVFMIYKTNSNVIENDSSSHSIGTSRYKDSSKKAAREEAECVKSNHHLIRCSDCSQVENNVKFIPSIKEATASYSKSTCVDETGDCNSSGSSLALDSCQQKFAVVSSVFLSVELDDAKTDIFHSVLERDDNMLESSVGDDKIGFPEMETKIKRMEGCKSTSLRKQSFDLSSASTLSTECLERSVFTEDELYSSKNAEYHENGPQCGMTEFSSISNYNGSGGDRQKIAVDKPPIDSDSPDSEQTKIAKKSVFHLHDIEMNALEAAEQVAIKAKLEVVRYSEHISNSPDGFCRDAIDGIHDVSDDISDDQMADMRVSESLRTMPAVIDKDFEMEKNHRNFDLNEDIYKNEIERSAGLIPAGTVKISTPIFVLASKVVPGLPVSSVHFEGESAWRCSSTFSAFRPTSPRRTRDSEKAPFIKQKTNLLEIDLNAAATQNDDIAPYLTQVPISSSNPSVEVSSRKAEKVMLDLNCFEDKDLAAQPLLIDLNYHPALVDADEKKKSKTSHICDSSKLADSINRINYLAMNRKLCNGMINNAVPIKPISHYHRTSDVYSYNDLQDEMALMPVQPTVLYRPTITPYMFDSVELDGMSAIPPSMRESPVLLNVAGVPAGLKGSISAITRLAINSSMAPFEAGRRHGEVNCSNFCIFNGTPEENLRTSLQASGSGMAFKRKEPEGGFKHATFWQ